MLYSTLLIYLIGTYIDSKITRIAAGLEYGDESSMQDLAGYIALLLVLDRLDPIEQIDKVTDSDTI